ncbi:MAG: hypothetical protein K1060chlam4_00735 [Candidatus Anoxychlamydiales bacterium]|nr:hypothetical protein [Candidatus Anoxychlamydiales bacterium]
MRVLGMNIGFNAKKMGCKVAEKLVDPLAGKLVDVAFFIAERLGNNTLSLEAGKDVSKELQVIIEESYTGVPLTEFKDQKKYEIFEKIYGKGYLEKNKDELFVFTF